MAVVTLMGDSSFDNESYVAKGEKDVLAWVHTKMPKGWRANLVALDGAVNSGIAQQLDMAREHFPETTHFVVSVGGNDALAHSGLMRVNPRSAKSFLGMISRAAHEFEYSYHKMLDTLICGVRTDQKIIACTIYNPNFSDDHNDPEQMMGVELVKIFNDAIYRQCLSFGVSIIEARMVYTSPEHYANPIEPSTLGAERISRAILEAVKDDPSRGYPRLFC
jgi:lysophospholipase L1-like esterase